MSARENVVKLHERAAELTAKAYMATRSRNAEVLWLVEHDGVSQTEVGRILGVSKQRVNAMLKSAGREGAA